MTDTVRQRGGKASPVKDLIDLKMIYNKLRGMGRFRDAELFLIGCNCALRISDLLRLTFGDIREVEVKGKRIGYVEIKEIKTKKHKRLVLNTGAMEALDRLKNLNPEAVFLFEGVSNLTAAKKGPISASYVGKLFREVRERLDLPYRFSTHSMRKTFGYNAYNGGIDIHTLQKLFNHSAPSETLEYIGITQEKVEEAYMDNVIGVDVGQW